MSNIYIQGVQSQLVQTYLETILFKMTNYFFSFSYLYVKIALYCSGTQLCSGINEVDEEFHFNRFHIQPPCKHVKADDIIYHHKILIN